MARTKLELRESFNLRSPVIACECGDIDNDGLVEVVLVTFDNYLHIFRAIEGELVETLETRLPTSITTLLLGDLDGNGTAEILVGFRDQYLRVYNLTFLNQLQEKASFRFYDQIHDLKIGKIFEMDDVNFVVGAGKFVHIFTYYEGQLREEGQMRLQQEVLHVAICDVDGDGKNEILLGTRANDLMVIQYESRFFQTIIATLHLDFYINDLEIIEDHANFEPLILVTTASGSFGVYRYLEKVIYPVYAESSRTMIKALAVSDLYENGREVIVLGDAVNQLRVFELDGTAVKRGQLLKVTAPIETVSVADLDGDGPKEVLVGLKNGSLIVYRLQGKQS